MTLVEMIVVIGLFALIGLALTYFSTGAVLARARALARVEAQEQARFAMRRLAYEVRRARDVEATSDFGVNLAAVGGSTLDLDMREAPNDPTTIDVSAGLLRIKQGAAAAVNLTTDDVAVTGLTFEDRDSPTNRNRNVKVTLTVERPDPGGDPNRTVIVTLVSAVQLRDR